MVERLCFNSFPNRFSLFVVYFYKIDAFCSNFGSRSCVQVEKESELEGRDLELEASQIRDYHNLKEKAAKRSTKINTEIEKLQREQQTDQEK